MSLINVIIEAVSTLAGNVPVYHYTKKDMGDLFVLRPKDSVKHRQSFSANDYKHSNFPRVFFYTDLNKTEHQVRTRFLYNGTVDGSKILNLQIAIQEYNADSEQYKLVSPTAYKVVHALLGSGRPNYDSMFKFAAKNYDGIFYTTGGIPMIVYFKDIELTRSV
ncbi:hypothetical protein [Microcystis phage Mel-JY01]